MALLDEVTIRAEAGKGGNGVVRWLHIRGKEKGGPAGGDGGRGGDIVLRGVRDLGALDRYRFEKEFKAENGHPGENNNRTGANGEPYVLVVPVGTTATILDTGTAFEVTKEEDVVIFSGGIGGRGNAHFKGPTNQNPFTATEGKKGEGGDIVLNLKLIADIGLVGLPNAGKSSLLNTLTNAKSKIGAYPFTTIEPHLGAFYGYVLADIPGLIEGASSGRGLGSRFLKHIEKTRILAHLVSVEQEDPVRSYREVRKELKGFGGGLSDKSELVILSKIDLASRADIETKQKALMEETGKEVHALSTLESGSVKKISDTLTALLRA
jgi:GTP-binding protein